MCIIIVKPGCSDVPAKDILEKCNESNKDGAGYMYARGGQVVISKGFFNLDQMCQEIEDRGIADLPMVLHFRIHTHGGVKQGLCHPFPLSKKKAQLNRLDTTCNMGIAHNGIFTIKTKGGESDTQAFVRMMVHSPTLLTDKEHPSYPLLSEFIGCSRVAVLTAEGEIVRHGTNWTYDGGCWYSNSSYKRYVWKKGETKYYGKGGHDYSHRDTMFAGADYTTGLTAKEKEKKKAEHDAAKLEMMDELAEAGWDGVEECPLCKGNGYTDDETFEDCTNCFGQCYVFKDDDNKVVVHSHVNTIVKCTSCGVSHSYEDDFCPGCGWDEDTKTFDLAKAAHDVLGGGGSLIN